MSGSTAITIISTTASSVTIVVIVILIRKCCRLKGWRRAHASVVASASRTSNTTLQPYIAGEGAIFDVEQPVERFLDEILREKPMRFNSQQLAAFTQNYAFELGSGGFGVVYKGQFPNGVQLAVKVLKMTLDRRIQDQFIAEIGTVGRTYHINLVRLYGFCFDKETKALVYEYLENGSLDKYLYDERHKLEWQNLHGIAVGAAKGIRYLHEECQQKIVHYDIKPANILLTADFIPKVADFGLAKFCDQSNTHITLTGGRGTPGYAAPELWMGVQATQKCDVYSFGMVLFEILGRRRNLDFQQSESQEWFPKWVWEKYERGEMESVLSMSGIEEKDKKKAEAMCKVALWCVQFQPDTRPTMSSVVRMLEGEIDIVPPVNPFQYLMPTDVHSSSQWTGTTKDSTSRGTRKDDSELGTSVS